MPDKLALSPDEIAALGRRALDSMAAYFESLAARPVLVPTTSASLRERLDEPLPQTGVDFGELLETLEDVVVRFNRQSAHPRFFGYVS